MSAKPCNIVDQNGVFVGVAYAQPDRTNPGEYRLPRGGTFASLPEEPWPEHSWPMLVEDEFILVPDYRGVTYWLNGKQYTIDEINKMLPEGATLEPLKTLEEVKADKKAEIERDREAEMVAPVEVHGRLWDADERSRQLISGALQIYSTTMTLPDKWRDASNNDMPITDINQLVAIATAIAQQVTAAYQRSWDRKAALEAATTFEEIEQI